MIPVNEPLLNGNEEKYITDCIRTNWISSAGHFIERFEREWADYCQRKHAVSVSNGTVALQLAVSVLDLPKNSEVIIPSFTIVSCIEAILLNNLIPVVVDCDPDTFCMDVIEVKKAITSKTSAIMPVHIYGHPVEMEPLMDLANTYGLKVIEDASEVHGAEYKFNGEWKKCGSFGDLSTFSFYANKIITTGEGGAILTDDELLYEKLKSGRNLCFGTNERFNHIGRGFNFRLTNLQAALGCAQLENIGYHIKRKRELMKHYNNAFEKLPIQTPIEKEWARSTVWMYAIVLHDELPFDAKEFALMLNEKGVQTRPFFMGMHEQKVYRDMGLFEDISLPITERIARRGLYLPSGQAITDEQIFKTIDIVKDILL